MFWIHNSAKAQIAREITDRARGLGRPLRVVDLGCGNGGDWPAILADDDGIELIAYEPDQRIAERAAERLSAYSATVHAGATPPEIDPLADVVVSLSVLEHVWDRRAYLQQAKKLLAPHGTLYLNYDDGHFRGAWEIGAPSGWLPTLKEQVKNLLAPVAAGMRRYDWYQAPVRRNEIDQLVEEVGFEIHRMFYSNLTSFKGFTKRLPVDQAQAFIDFWIEVEMALNEKFDIEMEVPYRGDRSALWAVMGSRTLVLRHAETPSPD